MARGGEDPFPLRKPDDDVGLFYTSGTTGNPKGAVISHRNIISNMFNSASAQARAFLRRGEAPPAPDPTAPQKAFLLSVPFFHATGCFAVMIPAFMAGHKIVLQRRWDCDAALEIMQRERITHFGGVPTIAWQVLENPRSINTTSPRSRASPMAARRRRRNWSSGSRRTSRNRPPAKVGE